MIKLDNDWDEVLLPIFSSEDYQKLKMQLKEEYETHTIYPDKEKIYNALKLTSLKDTRVVIIGQDPYHGPGQANGLAFSVNPGIPLPPSLRNIYKEIEESLSVSMGNNGDLTHWAEQGVLLLNNALTVREHQAGSHHYLGWEKITDYILQQVNQKEEPVIVLLWGSHAKKKGTIITNPKHLVLIAPHPSPLSAYRGFFGCGHFKQVNEQLKLWNKPEINWKII